MLSKEICHCVALNTLQRQWCSNPRWRQLQSPGFKFHCKEEKDIWSFFLLLKLTDYSIGFILCDQKWILHMDTAFATGLYDFKRLNMISNDPKYASMKSFGTEHNSFLILDSWKIFLKKQKKSWAFWRNQKINLLAKVFLLISLQFIHYF